MFSLPLGANVILLVLNALSLADVFKLQYSALCEPCCTQSGQIVKGLPLCQPVPSADNLCKQFGPRSGPTKCRARSGSKLFDFMLLFLKEFLETLILKKNVNDRGACKITQHARVKRQEMLKMHHPRALLVLAVLHVKSYR